MTKLLFAWIGNTDLGAATGDEKAGIGPIANAVRALTFDSIVLLFNPSQRAPKEQYLNYQTWLQTQTAASIELFEETLSRPTDYEDIYRAADRVVKTALKRHPAKSQLTFHLSPGTPAMTAVWIILAKTRFQADLIESSMQEGVRQVNVPFEIAAEFVPDLLREADAELQNRTAGVTPSTPAFSAILHRSAKMKKLIAQAERVAVRNVPVLLEGESGTGKELFAKAIHQASPRRASPFVAVNCGAIPAGLVESELFGHEKGAFTGANNARAGRFETASGGTLFLDEIGELPLQSQVKLLRVLQESEVVRVGASRPKKIDVRVISATNRNLQTEIAENRFREDLFYRLAVIVLKLPPLRERDGDVGLLIDAIWQKLNEDAASLLIEPTNLSVAARNVLFKHDWRGNVRELENTLTRLAITTETAAVSKEEAEAALLKPIHNQSRNILDRPLTEDFSLSELLGEVSLHYLNRALAETNNKKTAAARLLGMTNYQTLKNWLKKYEAGE